MTLYKVMWRTHLGLESLSRAPISVVYVPGVWTAPHVTGSKLFVFADYNETMQYLKHPGIEIWECEAENAIAPPFERLMMLLDTETTEMFWANGYKVPPGVAWSPMEPSTMIADRVKLTVQLHPAQRLLE